MRFYREICLFAVTASVLVSVVANADFVVIAKSSSSMSTISRTNLRDIFLGNKTFLEDGKRVFAVRPSDEKLNASFLESIVGINKEEFETHWRRRLFSGKAIPPKRFENVKQLIDYVADEPNAIGFVDDKELAGATKIKTVKITD